MDDKDNDKEIKGNAFVADILNKAPITKMEFDELDETVFTMQVILNAMMLSFPRKQIKLVGAYTDKILEQIVDGDNSTPMRDKLKKAVKKIEALKPRSEPAKEQE